MKSENEWKYSVVIRAVQAVAFACALAFAFALCLPTTKAFAETSTAGNACTVQDANENAEEADAGKMARGAEGDVVVADSEKDGDNDDSENEDSAEAGEAQRNGVQGLVGQPAQVDDPEDAIAAAGGNAQQVTAEPQNPSPEGADARLVANSAGSSSVQAADDTALVGGASSDSDDAAFVAQSTSVTEEWYKSFQYDLDDAAGTITLCYLDGLDSPIPSDIYVGKTATIDGKTYTTIIDNNSDDEDHWRNAFLLVGAGTVETITFEEGVKVLRTNGLFAGLEELTAVIAPALDLSACTDMSRMFSGCAALTRLDATGWDTSNVADMSGMFSGCAALTSLDVTGWDTGNVADMSGMFSGCAALTSLDVTGWDTSNVADMSSMFAECSSLSSLNLSGWDTKACTNMNGMFRACPLLEEVKGIASWDTSNVTNMSFMFHGDENLKTLNVAKWNTGSVTNMQGMFLNCESLATLDVSNWDVSKVKSFKEAFSGLPGTTVLDVRKWNASAVEPVDDGYGNMIYEGWAQTFSGPLVLVSDGQMAQRVNSGKNRADGKYIGIDYAGFYGIFLEDSMERVWCLNFGIAAPSGNLYTRNAVQLDEEGLQRLSTVFRAADTQMDKQERWEKIAAAITFFGNVLDADVQETLQYTIWHYSDNLTAPEGTTTNPIDADRRAKVKAMVDYIEANWQSLDYSGLKISFYDSGTNPTEPNEDGTYSGKYQNLISMSTAETVRHKGAGKLVVSKEIATGSDKDTDQVFTFTVKLKNADGTPYTMFVQVASEGEELHSVAPSQDGVITLTITGAGEAIIANLRPGTTYEIVEEGVSGWTLVGKSGEKGTIEENATSEAKFTNAEKGKEHLANKEEAKTEEAATKATAAKGGMAQTGDNTIVWPLIALALASLVTLVVARRKQNGR